MTSDKNESFESFLSNHISIVYNVFGNNFQKMNFGNDIHYTFSFLTKNYYEQSYKQLTIITDKKEIIKEIIIRFYPIIDLLFYNHLIINYGKPSSIKIFDSFESNNKSETEDKSFKQNLKMRIIKTKEGSFEENPLSIVWNKEKYQIHLLFRREYNVSDLIFKEYKLKTQHGI